MALWMQITLDSPSFYDPRTGKTLGSVDGMKNRPGVDPFESRGKTGYPVIEKSKIVEWHEKGTVLLIKADVTEEEAATAGTVLTGERAAQIKKDVFRIESVNAKSGVTQ